MVQIAGKANALSRLTGAARRLVVLSILGALGVAFLYGSCTSKVQPDEFGILQRRFGTQTGIEEKAYGAGLYLTAPGETFHTFPRSIHILEATRDLVSARHQAGDSKVDAYFNRRHQVLGRETHRTIDALTVQTSDGYSVAADLTLLYRIVDPVRVAKDFGWGDAYVDSFVINTFRSGALSTLGKMNAEAFYDEKERIAAVAETEAFLRLKFEERGFQVERLLLGHYVYAPNYEKSLHDKKVAVQLAEKNRKVGLVNDERAKLQQIDSKGSASITIAESEINTQVAKIEAEAQLYASQARAKADRELGLAEAETKRLKADALNTSGGRYVVALETAKMFDAIESAVMTPEQYTEFIRRSWGLVGLSVGGTR